MCTDIFLTKILMLMIMMITLMTIVISSSNNFYGKIDFLSKLQ